MTSRQKQLDALLWTAQGLLFAAFGLSGILKALGPCDTAPRSAAPWGTLRPTAAS